jgi:hypothetical protein
MELPSGLGVFLDSAGTGGAVQTLADGHWMTTRCCHKSSSGMPRREDIESSASDEICFLEKPQATEEAANTTWNVPAGLLCCHKAQEPAALYRPMRTAIGWQSGVAVSREAEGRDERIANR